MRKERSLVTTCLAVGALLLCSLPLAAQDQVKHANAFAVSAPLGELAKQPQAPQYGFHEANPVRRVPKRFAGEGQVVDRVEQSSINGPEASYSVIANFLGVGNGFPGYSVPDAPPDTNMAVGDTQVVQWVNVSYTVCSKTSPYTCGPAIQGNALWSSLGGICAANNDGDIIAQWDVQAHRWLLTQNVFASPYGVCVAISTTNDANGSYYLYEFPVVNNGFPDYPKWGVWVNNYGETWNNFGTGSYVGPVFCAYNRTKMLAGDKTAEQICHQYTISPNYNDSLLPADLDSATLPPSGQDQFAIGSVGDIDNSHLSLYSVHINNPSDWTKGATFTGDQDDQLIAIATFTPACNGAYGGACVPQKGITDLADSLGDRLMYRFAYWNEGGSGQQHWLVDFDVSASGGQNAVRWEDIAGPQSAVAPTAVSVAQEGTYAPDGNWRWMGSVARDKAGDILVGYSESCGNTCPGGTAMYPSIYVAGRTPSDPAGTLESEVQLVAGSGSQPDTANRWGDYSSMRIDQDGCTFWYTTEYYKTTTQFDWSTQIGSFSFAGCTGGGGGPVVSLAPTSLKWGKVLVGGKGAAKKVTLTNTGTAALSISTIATTGDFALVAVKKTKKVTPCVNGGTVAAGASCVVKVSFTPTQTGTRTGDLNFTDNAPGSPQSVALTGTGK
jgi:Cep192 domain 4